MLTTRTLSAHALHSKSAIALVLAGCLACATGENEEIGGPCTEDPDVAVQKLSPAPGTNNILEDDAFTECSSRLCASIDGGDPFCTQRCDEDLECNGGTCEQIVEFGPLACADYTPEDDCLTEEDPETGAPGFSKQPLRYCVVVPD